MLFSRKNEKRITKAVAPFLGHHTRMVDTFGGLDDRSQLARVINEFEFPEDLVDLRPEKPMEEPLIDGPPCTWWYIALPEDVISMKLAELMKTSIRKDMFGDVEIMYHGTNMRAAGKAFAEGHLQEGLNSTNDVRGVYAECKARLHNVMNYVTFLPIDSAPPMYAFGAVLEIFALKDDIKKVNKQSVLQTDTHFIGGIYIAAIDLAAITTAADSRRGWIRLPVAYIEAMEQTTGGREAAFRKTYNRLMAMDITEGLEAGDTLVDIDVKCREVEIVA